MGGLAGLIGTMVIGPRLGKYENSTKFKYINDDEILNNSKANKALDKYLNEDEDEEEIVKEMQSVQK